ncbi:hypothetical protein [Salinibacter sp. 10B]|uniref:hypothetical protein n=1 Tax=Salinibacter sp. 10B TaxID=1923971 RepID=UPI0015E47F5F|nr:hypothetical protein [Salinibacter sp. 10B]
MNAFFPTLPTPRRAWRRRRILAHNRGVSSRRAADLTRDDRPLREGAADRRLQSENC